MDLLTTVMQAMGTVLKMDSSGPAAGPHEPASMASILRLIEQSPELMQTVLPPGVRRVLANKPIGRTITTQPATSSPVTATSKVGVVKAARGMNSVGESTSDNSALAGRARRMSARSGEARFVARPAMLTRRVGTSTAASPPTAPTFTQSIGTLPPNKSVTIKFQVTVNSPFPVGVCSVTNQGTVTGNFTTVMTNSDITNIDVPPAISSCQSNISANTDPNLCTSSQSFTVTAAGCPAPTITCKDQTNVTITSPHAFPKGVTTVTCTAANGNPPDATCTFTVTVNDNQGPVFSGCTNITTNTAPGLCTAAPTFAPTATDNCDGSRPVTCNPTSGSTFNKGVTTVT
jgi:hypothetical protein